MAMMSVVTWLLGSLNRWAAAQTGEQPVSSTYHQLSFLSLLHICNLKKESACLHIVYVDAVSCLHIVYVDATACLHIVQVICYLVITWFCVNLPRSCCNIGWANSELVNVSKLQIDVNGAFRHSGWVLKETVAHAHNNFNIMVDQTQKRQGVASPPCDEC